jgi:hypothetical protein
MFTIRKRPIARTAALSWDRSVQIRPSFCAEREPALYSSSASCHDYNTNSNKNLSKVDNKPASYLTPQCLTKVESSIASSFSSSSGYDISSAKIS